MWRTIVICLICYFKGDLLWQIIFSMHIDINLTALFTVWNKNLYLNSLCKLVPSQLCFTHLSTYVIRMYTLKAGHCSFCGTCQNSAKCYWKCWTAVNFLRLMHAVYSSPYHFLFYLGITIKIHVLEACKIHVTAESHF